MKAQLIIVLDTASLQREAHKLTARGNAMAMKLTDLQVKGKSLSHDKYHAMVKVMYESRALSHFFHELLSARYKKINPSDHGIPQKKIGRVFKGRNF